MLFKRIVGEEIREFKEGPKEHQMSLLPTGSYPLMSLNVILPPVKEIIIYIQGTTSVPCLFKEQFLNPTGNISHGKG